MNKIVHVFILMMIGFVLQGQKLLLDSNGNPMAGCTVTDIPADEPVTGQIIADHTVVALYDDIPDNWMDSVKKMVLTVAGESHEGAYSAGLEDLEDLDSDYGFKKQSYPTGPFSDTALGYTGAMWGDYDDATGWVGQFGEEDWFTNATAISRIKANLTYCNTNGYPVSALALGWCYDAEETTSGATATADAVYGVHWYGETVNGTDGDKSWGLDDGDSAMTGNRINLDSYLEATQEYIDYCTDNDIPTNIFFTTGPVDAYANSEIAYQAYLKWERIRDYVDTDETLMLFDYGDILCFDDDGTPNTNTWDGHTYPHITTANLGEGNVGHIGVTGTLRLAKAMWWFLARMAGWDGETE